MMCKFLLISVILTFTLFSCGNKKKKVVTKSELKSPIVNQNVVKKQVDKQDVKETPKQISKPNKYFLISSSFKNKNKAVKFSKELSDKGLDSEVIVRPHRVNSDFFKVSYMGFSDKKEALKKLRLERRKAGNEKVWLLIK